MTEQLTLDQEVDAFWAETPRRTAPPQPARITCAVCDRTEYVPVTIAGRLCHLCRADLDATERHVRDLLASAEQALSDAWARWDADLAQSDEAEWWERVSAAALAVERGEMTQADYDRRAQSALAKGGPRAALLEQSEAMEALIRATERTRTRGYAALEEVREARDAG